MEFQSISKRPKLEDYEGTIGLHKNPRVNMLAKYSVDLEEYCDELEQENKSLIQDRALLIKSRQKLSNQINELQKENEILKEQLLNAGEEINNLQALKRENEELKLAYHDLYHSYLNDTIQFDWHNMEKASEIEVLEKALELACDELLENGVQMHDKCIYKYQNCLEIDCFEAIKDTFISKAKEELEAHDDYSKKY